MAQLTPSEDQELCGLLLAKLFLGMASNPGGLEQYNIRTTKKCIILIHKKTHAMFRLDVKMTRIRD